MQQAIETYPEPESVLIVALSISILVAQFYFQPKEKSKWRMRVRWLFYIAAMILTALISSRLYRLYQSIGT